MKLSEYAKKKSISYVTAYRHWQKGYIQGEQLPSGTIVVFDQDSQPAKTETCVIIYARVSSSENKKNLESQCNRLRDYASAKGYKIIKEVKEIGSGLNDKRTKLSKAPTPGTHHPQNIRIASQGLALTTSKYCLQKIIKK